MYHGVEMFGNYFVPNFPSVIIMLCSPVVHVYFNLQSDTIDITTLRALLTLGVLLYVGRVIT